MTVLDLGGTVTTWERAPVRPRAIAVLNLVHEVGSDVKGAERVVGNACSPPAEITKRRFDLVFSNSLIEHVGGMAARQALADVVHQLSDRHWVQTPYRYFPLEPHFLFPGFQFLPLPAQARVAKSWPLVHSRSATTETAVAAALDAQLLSKTEMRFYFPESDLVSDRAAGLTKSIVAVKGGG